jgi:hypothetical protein
MSGSTMAWRRALAPSVRLGVREILAVPFAVRSDGRIKTVSGTTGQYRPDHPTAELSIFCAFL